MAFLSYSQRLLNPFRGVVRVLRHGGAEAVTQNGWIWDIYVSNDELLAGLPHNHRVLVSEIRFGQWSPDIGLKRGPLHPSTDFRRMERQGAELFEYLLQVHEQPVFPFLDHYELWLLDENLQPLALLASTLSAEELDLDLPLTWQVGELARAQFLPAAWGAAAAEALSRQINRQPRPAAVWLRRDATGAGQVLAGIGGAGDCVGRQLPPAALPAYGLAVHGSPEMAVLIGAYLDWMAPQLLLLPSLETNERRRLEILARQRAAQVELQYRLYPEIVDPAQIQAARVEARMRSSLAIQEAQPALLSTFYIELSEGEV